LIVLIFPTTLVEFQQATNQAATAAAPESQLWGKIQVILIASLWAGVTEEFIYRGMLISFLRRWRLFSQQRINDLFAITLSGLLFGLSHLAMWGPLMSLSLIGIGIGFGLAYIATGETLLALIIYHILFDALSLSVSFLVPV
jgi:membrane protease YdiL (CAAX protease family)